MNQKKCEIENCPRIARTHGMCGVHYRRWRNGKRGEDLLAPVQHHDRSERWCMVKDCNRKAASRGMCHMHYKRWLRGTLPGDVLTAMVVESAPLPERCKHPGCGLTSIVSGYCFIHYNRDRLGKNMDAPIRLRGMKDRLCKVAGCEKKVGRYGSFGMCPTHYRQWKRKKVWEIIIADRGGKCARCGGVFPYTVYDLHHIDPKKKTFSIGGSIDTLSVGEILEEASKCNLLCANCHRLEHFGDGECFNGIHPGWMEDKE